MNVSVETMPRLSIPPGGGVKGCTLCGAYRSRSGRRSTRGHPTEVDVPPALESAAHVTDRILTAHLEAAVEIPATLPHEADVSVLHPLRAIVGAARDVERAADVRLEKEVAPLRSHALREP